MKSTICIHGAYSSPTSFNFLKSNIDTEYIFLEYSVKNGFYENLKSMLNQLDTTKKYKCISHSMGGIYAIHLTKHIQITKSVSISTPFNGSEFADYAKYLIPKHQLFNDISSFSAPVRESNYISLHSIPWLQIVTTGGNKPWIALKNDGVVSYNSMTHRKDVDYGYSHANHYEVMMSDSTVKMVQSFLDLKGK
jgi:hypothetical protein